MSGQAKPEPSESGMASAIELAQDYLVLIRGRRPHELVAIAHAIDAARAQGRREGLEEAAALTVEHRCVIDPPWDHAVTTIAAGIRALATKEVTPMTRQPD